MNIKINNKKLARSNAKWGLYANEIDFASYIASFDDFLLGIQRLLLLCQASYN